MGNNKNRGQPDNVYEIEQSDLRKFVNEQRTQICKDFLSKRNSILQINLLLQQYDTPYITLNDYNEPIFICERYYGIVTHTSELKKRENETIYLFNEFFTIGSICGEKYKYPSFSALTLSQFSKYATSLLQHKNIK